MANKRRRRRNRRAVKEARPWFFIYETGSQREGFCYSFCKEDDHYPYAHVGCGWVQGRIEAERYCEYLSKKYN